MALKKSVIAAAAAQAFEAAGEAKVTLQWLRLGPTTEHNPVTDTDVVTWEQETEDVAAVPFEDGSMKHAVALEKRTRSFVLLGTAVTAGRPDQSGQIVDEMGVTWEIKRAEPDPTKTVWTFHCTT